MSLPSQIKKFKSLESDFGTSVANDIWLRVAQMCSYIEKSYPVGSVMFLHETQDNLPATPDSKYWQELDGSTVSNANSPINGATLPDFRDKFMMHPVSGDVILSSSGNDSLSFAHDHGYLGYETGNADNQLLDNGEGRVEIQTHRHSMSSSSTPSFSTLPLYRALKCYVRIA